jgi:hypothetical protein
MRWLKGLIVASLLVPGSAFAAAVTWNPVASKAVSVYGVCAAGTTCDAPSAATDGMQLSGVAYVVVKVCADSGQTITDAQSFDVYFYDYIDGVWAQWSSSSLSTTKTGARCYVLEGDSPGHGIPMLSRRGRIAVVPTAVAVSSGAVTVYLYATDKNDNIL